MNENDYAPKGLFDIILLFFCDESLIFKVVSEKHMNSSSFQIRSIF